MPQESNNIYDSAIITHLLMIIINDYSFFFLIIKKNNLSLAFKEEKNPFFFINSRLQFNIINLVLILDFLAMY